MTVLCVPFTILEQNQGRRLREQAAQPYVGSGATAKRCL